MSDIFISYARSTEPQAKQVAEALRALGYGVWRDDELPAHRPYGEVIEERLKAAKAVVVIWSAEAVKSEWVRSEADRARGERKLVQLRLDAEPLPMPFDQVQCADLVGWTGDTQSPGWSKVVASVAELMGQTPVTAPSLPLPSKPSIAVLPFANLSGDPDQDYFADGMVVEITNALARFKSLFVIASGSTLSFKGKGVAGTEIARQLGVAFVLDGSVRKAGNRVRITVQLTEAKSGNQIWSQRFEDNLDDLFDLQDKVSLSVAAVIEPTVKETEIRRASERPTENMGSYDLYLRSLPLFRLRTKEPTLQALELVNRAIELDPQNAAALVQAARCQLYIYIYGWSSDPGASLRRALDLARNVLAMAQDDAEAIAGAASILCRPQGDLESANIHLARAVKLNPGSAMVWTASGLLLNALGDQDRALEHLQTAVRMDPAGPDLFTTLALLAITQFDAQDFEGAGLNCRSAIRLRPQGLFPHLLLALAQAQLGRIAEARASLTTFRSLSDQPAAAILGRFVERPRGVALMLKTLALVEASAAEYGRETH